MSKKTRYIVFERINGEAECPNCYHYSNADEILLQKDIIELDDEMAEAFRTYYWQGYYLVAVTKGEHAKLLVSEVEAGMKEQLEKEKEQKKKKAAAAAKRKATLAAKRKKKELEQLKKLQEKYSE